MRCEDYMYREKRSAKLDRILISLKEHVFQKKTEHARNSLLKNQSNQQTNLIFFIEN